MSQFSRTASQTQRTAQSSMYSTNSLIENELTNICEKNIITFTFIRSLTYSLVYFLEPLSELLIFSFLSQFFPDDAYKYAEVQPFLDLVIRLFPQCLYMGINPTIEKQLATNESALACSKIFMHASLYVFVYYVILIIVGAFREDTYEKIALFCSIAVSFEQLRLIYMLGCREMVFIVKNAGLFALEMVIIELMLFWIHPMTLQHIGYVEYLTLVVNFIPLGMLFSEEVLSLSFPVHLSQEGLRPFMPKLLLTSFVHFLESLGDFGPKTLINFLAMYFTNKTSNSSDQYKEEQTVLIFLYITLQKLFIAIPSGSLQAICQIASMCYETELYRKVHQIYEHSCIFLALFLCTICCFFFIIFRPMMQFFFSQYEHDKIGFARYAILTIPLFQFQVAQLSFPSVFNKSSRVMKDRYFTIAISFITLIAIVLLQRFLHSKQSFCYGVLCFDLTCSCCYLMMYVWSLRYVRRMRHPEVPKIDVSYNVDASGASAMEGKTNSSLQNPKVLSSLPINSMLSQGMDNNSSSARNNSNTPNLNIDSLHGMSNIE